MVFHAAGSASIFKIFGAARYSNFSGARYSNFSGRLDIQTLASELCPAMSGHVRLCQRLCKTPQGEHFREQQGMKKLWSASYVQLCQAMCSYGKCSAKLFREGTLEITEGTKNSRSSQLCLAMCSEARTSALFASRRCCDAAMSRGHDSLRR